MDDLDGFGDQVSDPDVVMHVLNGLNPKFNHFVITAQHWESTYTFGVFWSRLIHHDQCLKNPVQESTTLLDSINRHAAFFTNKIDPI